jgi:hypothetical protein
MQRGNWFPDARILNLGSRYAGWQRDVEAILEGLDAAPLERRFGAGPYPDMPARIVARAGEIRYFCLAGPQVITQTISAFGDPLPEHESEHELRHRVCDWPDDDHPPYGSNIDNERGHVDEGFPDPYDEGEPDSRDVSIASRAPYHAGRNQDSGSTSATRTVTVTVDCYGIYVSSLLGWLTCRDQRNQTEQSVLRHLRDDPDQDGPAVLLCPELIETAYRASLRDAPLPLRQELDLGPNPSRSLLREVLLHEIGHHIFSNSGDLTFLSEAMANWFAWMLSSPAERTLLHALSRKQDLPYGMYRGLVLLAGLRAFVPGQMALAGPPLGDALIWHLPEWISAVTFGSTRAGRPVTTHAPFDATWKEDRPQSSHFARFLIAAAQDLQPPGFPDLQDAICSAFDRPCHRMPLERERELLATVT